MAAVAGAVVAGAFLLDARIGPAHDAGAATDGDRATTVDAGARVPGQVPSPPTRPPGRGAYVLSAVTASGRVEVRTWIASARPVSKLYLSTPDPGRQPGSAEARDIVVRDLYGMPLARVTNVGTKVMRVGLNRATTGLFLSYAIAGGMDQPTPAVPGRELARVLSMVVTYDGIDGVVRHLVTVDGGRVLNVACVAANAGSEAAPRPCGRPAGQDQWTVDLHEGHRADRLTAQIERFG